MVREKPTKKDRIGGPDPSQSWAFANTYLVTILSLCGGYLEAIRYNRPLQFAT
jgi:hypothetical protein